ncbi:MAG: hypothetical protein LUE92_04440 [Clostridiales bacterium]|nr:hypothetical protein [Clostridiales bacterium]
MGLKSGWEVCASICLAKSWPGWYNSKITPEKLGVNTNEEKDNEGNIG